MSDQASDGQSVKMDSSGVKFIEYQIDEALKWSLCGQKAWSTATHSATICVIVLSAIAAVLSQSGVNWEFRYLPFSASAKNFATILSLLVTIISTIQAKLAFERKWIVNRMTHSALTLLFIDEKTGVDPEVLRDKLKEILGAHDKSITDAS